MKLVEGDEFLIGGFGREYKLKFIRMQYNKPIFETTPNISPYWCNTMGGLKGISFSDKCYITLPLMNLMDEKQICFWANEQIKNTQNQSLSKTSINVIKIIAISMMIKEQYSINIQQGVLSIIDEYGKKKIIENRIKWNLALELQANQLPF